MDYTNQKPPNLGKLKYALILKKNVWSADLADMHLIRKYNKGIWFLSCVIYVFSKYAWVALLIWLDKSSEFYNR